MEFTIVGAGQVGRSLESALTTLGHQVRMARRVPEAHSEVALSGSAQGCDAVILATPFVATGEIVPQLGIGQAQLVIDATNPFGRAWPAGFSTADFSSGGQFVQSLIPQAHVVKCFNVIGYEHSASTSSVMNTWIAHSLQAFHPSCRYVAMMRKPRGAFWSWPPAWDSMLTTLATSANQRWWKTWDCCGARFGT
ncbi:MAG: NAD(P)-binding domain-containing protein [Actinobacteria bacterium]|nr:NAD(P)-binding domain-containing protein [Actinomycetota bacterium]